MEWSEKRETKEKTKVERVPEKLLTPAQVAEQLQVGRDIVYRWLRSGQLKGLRAGTRWRVTEEELLRFLSQGQPWRG